VRRPGKVGVRVYFSGIFQPAGFVSGSGWFTIKLRFAIGRIRLRRSDMRSAGSPKRIQPSPAKLVIKDLLRHFDKFIAVDCQECLVGE
jgi:hypothetical protein